MKYLRILTLLIMALFLKSVSYAQISQEVRNQLFDKKPEFTGGKIAYEKFLDKKLVYPNITNRDKRIASVKVISQFVVEKNGKLSNFSFDCEFDILGDYSQEDYNKISELYSDYYHTSMNDFLLKMPRWKPAEYKGKKVSTVYELPVVFRYSDAVVPKKKTEDIFVLVEKQPEFPGGESALIEYINKNISYPQQARDKNIQGTVFVTFVIEANGSISNAKILKGIGGGCDEEAIRIVKNMPPWEPGKQRGKPVRVQYNLPIKFIAQ
ncbi:MAG: energy transducer TonB [Bacteroidales bacterium]|nr:energy transducer TonB [Bacteroidales bacterium]